MKKISGLVYLLSLTFLFGCGQVLAQTDTTKNKSLNLYYDDVSDKTKNVRQDTSHKQVEVQTIDHRWFAGINLTNNLTNILANRYKYGGLSVEVFGSLYISSSYLIRLTTGYANVSSDEEINDEQQVKYRSTGGFAKAGIYYYMDSPMGLQDLRSGIGVQFAYARSVDEGQIEVAGPYFGNYQYEYKMEGQQFFYLEICADVCLFKYNNMGCLLHTNIPLTLYDGMSRQDRYYFIPGYGRKHSHHSSAPFKDYLKMFPYRLDLYLTIDF